MKPSADERRASLAAARRGCAARIALGGVAPLFIGLGLAAAVLGAGPARAAEDSDEPKPPRVEVIRFLGADAIDPGRLRAVMRLHAGVWWRPFQRNYFYGVDHLEPDLERILAFLHAEGFFFARIEDAVVRYLSRDRVAIEIRVYEGPRVRVSAWELKAPDGLLKARLRGAITLETGEPLRESRVAADEARMTAICAEAGYALARVRHDYVFSADSARVRYAVDPGREVRVGEIRIEGLERTRPAVVRRELALRGGDLYRRSRAETSRDRLFDLGLFRTVRIAPSYCDTCPGESARVDLRVVVEEKPPGWYGGGLGASSRDEIRLLGEWGYRNLAGRAYALQMNALAAWSLAEWERHRVDDPTEWQVQTALAQPWLFGAGIRGQVRASYRFNREPTFEDRIVNLELVGRRDLGRTSTISGSVRKKWVSSTDPLADRRDFEIPSLSMSLRRDTRDFALDPHRGALIQTGIDHAGGLLGGSVSFLRGALETAEYRALGHGWRWAYRARVGWLHPWGASARNAPDDSLLLGVPFDERFRAGGGTTVRGYQTDRLGPYSGEDQPLGGLALGILNVELRFPIVGPFEGALFLDAGNVWADLGDVKFKSWFSGLTRERFDEHDAAHGGGVGLRFRTPVGPLRLDLAWKLDRCRRAGASGSEMHFSLGQAF